MGSIEYKHVTSNSDEADRIIENNYDRASSRDLELEDNEEAVPYMDARIGFDGVGIYETGIRMRKASSGSEKNSAEFASTVSTSKVSIEPGDKTPKYPQQDSYRTRYVRADKDRTKPAGPEQPTTRELPIKWNQELLDRYLLYLSRDGNVPMTKEKLPSGLELGLEWTHHLSEMRELGITTFAFSPIVYDELQDNLLPTNEIVEMMPPSGSFPLPPDLTAAYDYWKVPDSWRVEAGKRLVGKMYTPGLNSVTERVVFAKDRFTTASYEELLSSKGMSVVVNAGRKNIQMILKSKETPNLSKSEINRNPAYGQAVSQVLCNPVKRTLNAGYDFNKAVVDSLGLVLYEGPYDGILERVN